MDGLEEGELNSSPVPSQGDLDILSGDQLKKVSWKQETKEEEDKEEKSDADDEDDEEDQEVSQYFDAKQKTDTPPLASSTKKKAPKVKKKVKRAETHGSSDDSLFSSVSQHSLASSCSPEQLKKKAKNGL